MPGLADSPAPPRLILASRSPRRASLLREAGYAFEQANPPFEDPNRPELHSVRSPEAVATHLAEQKARSLQGALPQENGPGRVILASDTICVGATGELIGKPANRDDLMKMLDGFVNATHRVVTGVALVALNHPPQEIAWADTAAVTWGDVSPAQRQQYADSGAWSDKAGGYNLHERLDAGWPITVTGDPTTVTGLPMRRLTPQLRELGLVPNPTVSTAP